MKKSTIKKVLSIVWVIYALASVFIIIYLTNNLICKDINDVSNKLILSDGWDVNINNELYEDVDLDEFSFSSLSRGDKVTMTRRLPDEWSYNEPALCIYNRHTTTKIYVDDEMIFEYGEERFLDNETVGCGYQFANFFNEFKGKELRVEYVVTENKALSMLDSMWLCEWNNAYRFIITENRIPFLMGSFLVVFGVVATMVTILAVVVSRKYMNVLFLSLFSICIGLWTLCYYDVTLIFSIPLYSISLMEYMALYIAPIPILGYMFSYVKKIENKRVIIGYKILFVVQFLFTVVFITLHTVDIIHAANVIGLFMGLLAIHLANILYIFAKNMKKLYRYKKMYFLGLVAIFVCIVYELAGYYFDRFVGFSVMKIKGSASIGIVIFIAILVLDLYNDIAHKMMEEHEKAILIRKAYTDDLTQIKNRAFCQELMDKFDKEDNHEYTIFTFDLNGLKQANDTYGHAKGDILIKEAANVISDAFSPYGVVGRMGGDEFIAIIEKTDELEIKKIVSEFHEKIKEKNTTTEDINLSIAYGYANCKEVEGGTEKVYQLADGRMYSLKKQQKQGAY